MFIGKLFLVTVVLWKNEFLYMLLDSLDLVEWMMLICLLELKVSPQAESLDGHITQVDLTKHAGLKEESKVF